MLNFTLKTSGNNELEIGEVYLTDMVGKIVAAFNAERAANQSHQIDVIPFTIQNREW